jgi:hypothetical protein
MNSQKENDSKILLQINPYNFDDLYRRYVMGRSLYNPIKEMLEELGGCFIEGNRNTDNILDLSHISLKPTLNIDSLKIYRIKNV